MIEDDYLQASIAYSAERNAIELTVSAKRAIQIVELQGYTSTLEQFGACMPKSFQKKVFGEGVEIPPEMAVEMEVINKSQFRWGCDIFLEKGSKETISIQSTKCGEDSAVFTLAYAFTKLFGLSKGEGSIYVNLLADPE